MKDFCWNIFEKSGSIEAFLAYKEFSNAGEKAYNISNNSESREFNE